MRLALAILGNALLVSALLAWLRAEYRRAGPRLRRWLLPALGWRLLFSAFGNAHPGPDARLMLEASHLLANGFWARPTAALALWQGSTVPGPGEPMQFYAWSNTLYFSKLLAMLEVLTAGGGGLLGLYLSLFCFVACWSLLRVLCEIFPLAPAGAAGVAFLAWPSVVWWTAGLTKETLVVGAGAGVVALALPLIYRAGPVGGGRLVGRALLSLLLAWVMFRTRYFFALPLLGGLLALAVVRLATRRGWLGPGWWPQASGLLLVLALLAGPVVVAGSQVVSGRFLVDEINRNYHHGLRTSAGRPHLDYAHWQPTPLGLLRHALQAAAQVLARPWPGESRQPLYLAAGLENIVLLGLLGLAAVAAGRGRAGRLPPGLVVALALYCLLLATFIGLSTPNLGTLHRYRVALLPWLLLLVLQNDYARGLLKKVGL